MKPKEKAKELIDNFKDENYYISEDMLENSKTNALICINEIIKSKPKKPYSYERPVNYWFEVKKELNNMKS